MAYLGQSNLWFQDKRSKLQNCSSFEFSWVARMRDDIKIIIFLYMLSVTSI